MKKAKMTAEEAIKNIDVRAAIHDAIGTVEYLILWCDNKIHLRNSDIVVIMGLDAHQMKNGISVERFVDLLENLINTHPEKWLALDEDHITDMGEYADPILDYSDCNRRALEDEIATLLDWAH